jgi:mannosyltransferase PIG-V
LQQVAAARHRRRAEARAAPRVWRDVLLIWAASRAFFLGVGALGHAFVSRADPVGTYREPSGLLSYWANWDGAWFAHIAQHGYDTASATAFFPLYPILVRGVMLAGPGPALAGVVVSTVAALAALYFVHELARRWRGARVARTATLALAFFPTGFYLNAVYSESLFLALSAGSLWALYVRRDLLVAGMLGYLAAATRNVGVVLVVPLALEWLRHRRGLGTLSLVGVAGPPLGLGAYAFYLWKGTSKPLLFAVAYKATWGRTTTNPLVTVRDGWQKAGEGLPYLAHPGRVLGTTSANPPFPLANTLGFVFLVVLLALLVVTLARLPLPVGLYAIPVALGPLLLPGPQVPLIGLPRYALEPFPVFVALGIVLARSRVALAAWLALSLVLGTLLTLEFVSWRWVA